jgi:hypothetical protein
MGFPDNRPPASGAYQDDATLPDNGSYVDDLSPADYGGSTGDLADRYEDTSGEADDDEDYSESDELDELGDDELYDEEPGFGPAGRGLQDGWNGGETGSLPPDAMT